MPAPTAVPSSQALRIGITVDPEIPVPPLLYGGIERVVSMLVEGLVRKGHEVTLFAHRDSRVPCTLVPFPGTDSRSLWGTLEHTYLILKTFRRTHFDVIHSFGRLAYLLPLLPARVPKLMTYQRDISPRSIRLGRALSRGTLGFSAISRAMLARVGTLANWDVVPNGVSRSHYEFRPHVEPDAPLVFLGRIEQIKGPHIAIEIASQLARRLILAGNISKGADHARFFEQHIAPHIDGDRIRYVGPVTDEQKNLLLGRAAALLMPVLWSEPFGIVMVEALACGTPVIGLRNGAVPEVVQHGTTGFVCDSIAEMAAAVGRLGEIDRANCRKALENQFSEEVVVEAYLAIYRRMLERA